MRLLSWIDLTEASPLLIPQTENSPVVRTDYSDDAVWDALCVAMQEPVDEFQAFVDCLSDPAYDGLTVEQLQPLVEGHYYLFIVDREAITNPEHPILVLDLGDEPGRTFRVIPAEMWAVENNLSIANMDFAEFADNVDEDGVYRGGP